MSRGRLKFVEEIRDGITVLHLNGKLIGDVETKKMSDHIKELIVAGTKHFVINLNQVNWINSSGIGALIACMTSVRNGGGDLRLVILTEAAKKYFKITNLDTVIKIYDNVIDAVKSYNNETSKAEYR